MAVAHALHAATHGLAGAGVQDKAAGCCCQWTDCSEGAVALRCVALRGEWWCWQQCCQRCCQSSACARRSSRQTRRPMGARRSREASARLELGRRQPTGAAWSLRGHGYGWSWGNTYREGTCACDYSTWQWRVAAGESKRALAGQAQMTPTHTAQLHANFWLGRPRHRVRGAASDVRDLFPILGPCRPTRLTSLNVRRAILLHPIP